MAEPAKRSSSSTTSARSSRTQAQATPAVASGPSTLQSAASTTWRLLIIVAGIAVLGIIAGRIFPVIFALFFAMLVT
ncbi:MAG: hypothetical protein ACKN9D_10370, partial [Actinomycetales bacterium]